MPDRFVESFSDLGAAYDASLRHIGLVEDGLDQCSCLGLSKLSIVIFLNSKNCLIQVALCNLSTSHFFELSEYLVLNWFSGHRGHESLALVQHTSYRLPLQVGAPSVYRLGQRSDVKLNLVLISDLDHRFLELVLQDTAAVDSVKNSHDLANDWAKRRVSRSFWCEHRNLIDVRYDGIIQLSPGDVAVEF